MPKSARKEEISVTKDERFGFYRLDPLPTPEELEIFYQKKYYDLVRKGTKGRAPEIRRLMEGGQEGQRELAWLETTLFSDVLHVLKTHAPGKRVLEIGCGMGHLLASLKSQGFETVGIEPAEDAAKYARELDLEIHNMTLEQFSENAVASDGNKFDAVILISVLEHILDPVSFMKQVRDLLNEHGIVFIRVPNDFNDIQLIAQQALQKAPWWMSNRDHINYFDFSSLRRFLEGLRFEIIHSQGDFPMEMFLLMGDDYVGNPEIGNYCHQKRVNLEMALPPDLRRKMYMKMAEAGISRCCIMAGKRK